MSGINDAAALRPDQTDRGTTHPMRATARAALSKQISALEQAGYVTVDKTGAGRRSRTYVQLSKRGRKAFDAHVAALQAIVNGPAPHANAEPPEGPRARTTDTTSQQTTARHSS